jgi:hypothetical protein
VENAVGRSNTKERSIVVTQEVFLKNNIAKENEEVVNTKQSRLFCEEYSHHPEEDIISKIEVEDLYNDMIMSENEAIRIKFTK